MHERLYMLLLLQYHYRYQYRYHMRFEKMKKRKSGLFKKRILDILPEDDSKMQSTELFKEARKPWKDNQYKGMGPNTASYYLKSLIKEGLVNRIHEEHGKEVYYAKSSKNVKMMQLSEEIIKEKADLLLRELRRRLEKTIKLEVDYCEKNASFEDEEEKNAFVNEIINEDELKLTLGRILVEYGKELIKSAYTKR